MNKETLKKDLKEVIKKHHLNVNNIEIQEINTSENFYNTNSHIFDNEEYWFEKIEVDYMQWFLSDYDKTDINLDFIIGEENLIHSAVLDTIDNYKDCKDLISEVETMTLEQIKKEVNDDEIFNEILDNIMEYIKQEQFYDIRDHLFEWFGCYAEDAFNVIEALGYWTTYFAPRIADETIAFKTGLLPFEYDGEPYLALGGCGMDLSPRLDAYQALTDGTIPASSQFIRQPDYAKYVVGEKIFEEVVNVIKCSPIIHISTF